jgi:uncharacterized Fe-S cluster-containing radical SAM superfamily enzyme
MRPEVEQGKENQQNAIQNYSLHKSKQKMCFKQKTPFSDVYPLLRYIFADFLQFVLTTGEFLKDVQVK